MSKQTKLSRFNDHVLSKYQVYNSVFMTLPFDNVTKTGTLLPLFNETCIEGFKNGKTPTEIVSAFFDKYKSDCSEEDRIGFLFKFIQYIERQVVLFDAIEDAAFPVINNMNGIGTMRNINEGDSVVGMTLEHYPGMTEKELQKIIDDASEKWRLIDALIVHRVGDMTPGEPIVLTVAWSMHRKDAFEAVRYLMEALKSRAPFWKKETLADGGSRWVERNTPGY